MKETERIKTSDGKETRTIIYFDDGSNYSVYSQSNSKWHDVAVEDAVKKILSGEMKHGTVSN